MAEESGAPGPLQTTTDESGRFRFVLQPLMASLLAIRDGAVYMNRCEVIVPPVSRFLDVRLTPAKQGTYLPGEEAAFTVTATVSVSQLPAASETLRLVRPPVK